MIRAFVDTNILVYLFDRRDTEKRSTARALLEDWHGQLVVSTQVLQEFYVTTTRKLEEPLAEVQAEEACQQFSAWPTVPCDAALVLRAIDFSRRSQISLWDSLILSSALEARCTILLSEDLQHGQVFDTLEVVNPFVQNGEVHEPRS